MRQQKENEFLTGVVLGLIVFLIVFIFSLIDTYGAVPTDVLQAVEENERTSITEEEIDILVHLVKAEAGNQTFLGKQLVVDVVLNRMRSDKFPDTVKSVIYASGQFACSGYFMNKKPTEEDYEAVYAEIEKRQSREVIYFRTKRYGDGSPLFKEDDHYFSGL